MPAGSIPISISRDFTFPDSNTDLLLADTGLGGPFTGVTLAITVSDLSGISQNYALFGELNGNAPGQSAQCVVTPNLGVLTNWTCDETSNQPSRIQVYFYPRGTGSFPRTLRVNATGSFTFSAAGDCAYGTRPKAGASFVYWLTPALLDTWLATAGLPWVAPFLTALWFSSIDLTGICGSGPGPLPVLDQSVLGWTTDQKISFIKSVAWFTLCECIPGSPPAIPFPTPTAPPPPNIPPFPTFPCSDADPCAAIIQLQRSVAAIQQSVSSTNELVTLLQRYRLPFAYTVGAGHLNLQNAGTFTVPSRLLGLLITIDSTPPGSLTLPGTPVYQENLGWISVLDVNGFIAEKRVTRSPQVWMPEIMPDVITVGYNLNPGVVIHVNELQAEP